MLDNTSFPLRGAKSSDSVRHPNASLSTNLVQIGACLGCASPGEAGLSYIPRCGPHSAFIGRLKFDKLGHTPELATPPIISPAELTHGEGSCWSCCRGVL
jgi:hypothetical protein